MKYILPVLIGCFIVYALIYNSGERFEYKRGNLIHYNPYKKQSIEPFVYTSRGIAVISNDSMITYSESLASYKSTSGGYIIVDWSRPYVPIIRIYENRDKK